jgi:polar amino acid transport system permease protein
VQLFWFYYALPLVGLSFDPITTGILVLAAHAGGYGAEIVRGALTSVSVQQHEAARALNFSRFQTLFRISLPQAIVEMMPAFGNLAIETLKLSSLVSLISIADLTFAAQSIRNITLDSASIYSITLVCYFAMSLVLMIVIRVIERLVRRGHAFPQMPRSRGHDHMMYGYEWDTTTWLTYTSSILPIILIGLTVTLKAAAAGFAIALVLGLVFALLRRSRVVAISWPTAFVVEFLRDTPLLVQLFFLYYVLPDFGVVLPAFLTGAIALGLQYAAYTSEVYRGGIEAVARGQWEAATALNLTRMQAYRDIIIPQAIPRIVPAMGNYLVAMIKETPVLSVVTVMEMMGLANMIGERTFEYLVPLTLVGLIFLLLTLICSAGLHRLQKALPKAGIPLR